MCVCVCTMQHCRTNAEQGTTADNVRETHYKNVIFLIRILQSYMQVQIQFNTDISRQLSRDSEFTVILLFFCFSPFLSFPFFCFSMSFHFMSLFILPHFFIFSQSLSLFPTEYCLQKKSIDIVTPNHLKLEEQPLKRSKDKSSVYHGIL